MTAYTSAITRSRSTVGCLLLLFVLGARTQVSGSFDCAVTLPGNLWYNFGPLQNDAADYVIQGTTSGDFVLNFCRSTVTSCVTSYDDSGNVIMSRKQGNGSSTADLSSTSGSPSSTADLSSTSSSPPVTSDTTESVNSTGSTASTSGGSDTTADATTGYLTTGADVTTGFMTTGAPPPPVYAAGCIRTSINSGYYMIGNTKNVHYDKNSTEVVSTIGGGLNDTSMIVHFICAKGKQKVNTVTFLREDPQGVYHFQWATQQACDWTPTISNYFHTLTWFQDTLVGLLTVGILMTLAAIIAFLVLTYRKSTPKSVLQ